MSRMGESAVIFGLHIAIDTIEVRSKYEMII